MRAILYSRWSSLEQSGTTSSPRQTEATESFARRHNWEVVERICDEGQSAWTGANISTGNLGQLLARLEPKGGDGLVLVVEKLDRLSRQSPLVMAAWVQRACATGLVIATADGAHLIDADRLNRDQMTVLAMIFEAFRGYSESQTKSERVADAWARKRERGAAMTRRCPAWLTIAPGTTSFRSAANARAVYEVVKERATLVRRIFDLTANGTGKATIAAMLNREGVACWGTGAGWHASYIQKIVRNPAVIGVYQPHTAPRGGKRTAVGEPIDGYFPAIVPADLFHRVNDERASRILALQSPNRLVNLLAGLGRCAACGATMTMLSKGAEKLVSGAQVPRRYLKCSAAHRSAGCANRQTFTYDLVEGAILDKLLHLAMDELQLTGGEEISAAEGRLMDAERRLNLAERQQAVAYSLVEEDSQDEHAVAKYRERKDQAKAARADVVYWSEALARLRSAISPEQHQLRIAEVRSHLVHGDENVRYEARKKVKLALNDLIGSVSFEARKRRFSVELVERVRVLAFDAEGTCGLDFDWQALGRFEAARQTSVVVGYLRRKEQAERVSA